MNSEISLFGYASGNFGKNLVYVGVDVTLLYVLTDLLAIPAASVSRLLAMVFIGDLFFDIAAGYLASAITKSIARYRLIILVGAGPCGALFGLLYCLPALECRNLIIIAAVLLGFRAAYAIIDVPHNALLARVAQDSYSRGRASGYRYLFSAVASLAVAGVLAPAVTQGPKSIQTNNLAWIGLAGGALCFISLVISAWSSREPRDAQLVDGATTLRRLLPKIDRPMLAMGGICIVTGFAMPMFSRMVIYLTTYVFARPDLSRQILLAITIGQLPGVALWTVLVRHWEKTSLLAVSYAGTAGGLIAFVVGENFERSLIPIAFCIGVGLAGVFLLPWGIFADMIDFAEFRHRERREAATFACMLVVLKASAAAALVTVSAALGQMGYVPGARQSFGVKLVMQILAIGVPLLGCILAVSILARVSMGHHRHKRVVQALQRRSHYRHNKISSL